MKLVGGVMEKDKLTNVKLHKSMIKLIGTVVLVDSLIVGTFALGGHIPIHQDNKKIHEVSETITKEWDGGNEITVSNYLEGEIEQKNRVVYYKKPYEIDGRRVREVVTVCKGTMGPIKDVKTVLVDENEPDISYVETYEYDINLDRFITVKETLYDEVLSDTALLMMLGIIDTGFICVGKSFIKRKEDENEKKDIK